MSDESAENVPITHIMSTTRFFLVEAQTGENRLIQRSACNTLCTIGRTMARRFYWRFAYSKEGCRGRASATPKGRPLKKPASKAKKAKPSERRYRSARWDSLTTHQTTADATRETTGHLLRNCNLDATQTVRA